MIRFWIACLFWNIRPNSVIVTDNASHHNRNLSRFSGTSSTKTEIHNSCSLVICVFEEKRQNNHLFEILGTLNFQKCYYVCANFAAKQRDVVLKYSPYHSVFGTRFWHVWLRSKIILHNKQCEQGPNYFTLLSLLRNLNLNMFMELILSCPIQDCIIGFNPSLLIHYHLILKTNTFFEFWQEKK